MAASKKNLRQEDKNLAKLREIGARPENKTCFDCGQKGPTYVNTTIGSFVCTHCSGLLRGLTPPHRVKSISMASFSIEELENLAKHGNDYCRKVWLGTYDDKLGYPDFKDEHKVRDFMIAKYERKKYYVDPANVDRNRASSTTTTTSTERTPPVAKPLSSLVPHVVTLEVRAATSSPSQSPSAAESAWKRSTGNLLKSDTESRGGKPKFDPFGSLPTSPTHSKPVISQPNFADFDNNPVFLSSSRSTPFTPAMTSVSPPTVAAKSSSSSTLNFGSPPMPVPTLAPLTASASSAPSAAAAARDAAPAVDRYAALADLDELFKQTSVSSGPGSSAAAAAPPHSSSGAALSSSSSSSTGVATDWGGAGANGHGPHAGAPWMKPSGFQHQNGAVPNPFQNPSPAAAAPGSVTQVKSTNPFAANNGGADATDSFAWGQPAPTQLPPSSSASQANWANFGAAPVAQPSPWGPAPSAAPVPQQQAFPGVHQQQQQVASQSSMAFGHHSAVGNGGQGFFGTNPWSAAPAPGGFSAGAPFMAGPSAANPFAVDTRFGTGTTAPAVKSNPFL